MKSASSTPITQPLNRLPEDPPNGVTGGLDWARDDHAVSVVDARGREVVRHSVEHSAAGLVELVDVLTRAKVRELAIERPDGPVVQALLDAALTVVVISQNQVKNLRGRYGSAGNKDDRFDAFVLADTLRTDRARLPDAHIFTSLPRSGRVRAARLLAEIGDCRARFPTPEALSCLAGAAPSTRQSGKIRTVGFRWACDKQLRDAVTDFAADSRRANPWAADLYNRARARGHDHPHAVRVLARAWLHVIWKCWQDRVNYNPAEHGALQRLLQDQQLAA